MIKKILGFDWGLTWVGLAVSVSALAQTGEVSFTPTGLKFPIMKITISQNGGSSGTATSALNEQTLYKCASTTEANCLVDLTSQTDLDKISASAQSVSITAGTYNQLSLYSCADGKGGSSQVSIWIKATFTASGTTYYTDPTSSNTSGITSSGSTADFTEITNWGCSTKTIILATPITVGSSALALTTLVDNTFLGNSTPNNSPGMGGCKAPSGGSSRGICANIPALLPYVGTGAVSTKRFKLAHNISSIAGITDSKANAIVIIPTAGTTPLTVFAGPYYSETSAATNSNTNTPTDATNGGPSYNTSTDVSSFKVNADGSVVFSQGASADTYAGSFSAFKLSDHTGSLTTRGGTTWYYHAILF